MRPDFLDLPFFDDTHRQTAARVERFADETVAPLASDADRGNPLVFGKRFIEAAAAADLLPVFVPGVAGSPHDLRSLCLAREIVAARSAFADSVLAVQGLGAYPIALAGSDDLKQRYLAAAARGTAVGAFALTEPEAGSDASAISTTAVRDGGDYLVSGTKTLISNAGIATFYVVFLKTTPDTPANSAVVVDADADGCRVTKQIDLIAPHPIGEVVFDRCRVPVRQRLGDEGGGMKIALATLDHFRASVGAAACGVAGRALDETIARVTTRKQFGSALEGFQATRLALADMATEFEAAQRIVDRAVQLHGGVGVTRGTVVERLYREVRAPRIYEGTSEIQRLVVADQLLKSRKS